jgi:glycosyltransferase involved in cell wall biosynthesis
MKKSLLIVEESLMDLNGHFFDYVQTISEEVIRQGWRAEVASHIHTADEIKKKLAVHPVFQKARFAGAQQRGKLDRFFGLITHNWYTLKNLWALLKKETWDMAFVPTALPHHLLAWWIVMRFHPKRPRQLTLLFLNTPAVWNKEQKTTILPRRARVTGMLIRMFKQLQRKNLVRLSVQTNAAKKELETLTGLPFDLLPQPVNHIPPMPFSNDNNFFTYGFFGFTRYEKGADLLVDVLRRILREKTGNRIKFRIQWTSSFQLPDGTACDMNDEIAQHPSVDVIRHSLTPAAYYELFSTTDCLLLPYRNSSYYSRDSRITIEAVTTGKPVIFTKGGWLDETVSEYGAGIGIMDESAEDLYQAIRQMSDNSETYKGLARQRAAKAKAYYGPDFFVKKLLRQ